MEIGIAEQVWYHVPLKVVGGKSSFFFVLHDWNKLKLFSKEKKRTFILIIRQMSIYFVLLLSCYRFMSWCRKVRLSKRDCGWVFCVIRLHIVHCCRKMVSLFSITGLHRNLSTTPGNGRRKFWKKKKTISESKLSGKIVLILYCVILMSLYKNNTSRSKRSFQHA